MASSESTGAYSLTTLPAYAELHCLSNFSFQRGASHAQELVEKARELGYTALAITDECSLAGIVRAWQAIKSMKGDPLKLIVGAEFTLDDGLKLVLLAPDRHAYGDLSALITLGRRAATKGEYRLTRDEVANHARGLLALWIPPEQPEMHDAQWFRSVFEDRAWIAVELLQGPDDGGRLRQLRWLSSQSGLPCVAAGDVHMHTRSRRALQDVMTALRLHKPVAECGHALFPNGERHLRPRHRLGLLYPPELLAETLRVAERCTFDLGELRYEYPDELVPEGKSAAEHLAALTAAGLLERYPGGVPEKVQKQVEHELDIIRIKQYEPYFLTVHDIVQFARNKGILCQGRGSAANSAVCYVLGITAVDPALGNSLFERFISIERDEPPDIDVDFEHDRREEVIQYLYTRYSRDRAALAATVITYRPKSTLRDLGRALGLATDQLDRLSRNLSWWDQREELPLRLVEAGLDPANLSVQLMLKLTDILLGFPRHLSQHVGGFVITRGPVNRLVPVENASMKDRTVIQWDKDDLDAMGLLKVDVLALGMLSALRRSMNLVTALRGTPQLTLANMPKEDPLVYQMMSRADTVGVFQIESRAQMSMLPRLKPNKFYDLVIEVAIVRPGPIQGGMVHPYLKRRNGQEAIEPMTPAVAQVLDRTCGVPIFQEQVMKLAQVAAGFSATEADGLRRAMAAWRRTGKLEVYKQKLMDGLKDNGYSEEFATRLYNQIKGFSEYGFPESHAASFALLVYASAWLKYHEPAAFLCSMLNSLPMGFYSASQLIQDAQRHGIEVRPVDVQHSDWDCTLEETDRPQPVVRLGMRQIKGLNETAVIDLARLRPAAGFESVAQVQKLLRLDTRDMTALTEGGAFETLAGHRRQVWWQAAAIDTEHDLAWSETDGLFPDLPAATLGQDISADYRSLRLSLRAHPLSLLRERLRREKLVNAAELKCMAHGRLVKVCGIVVGRQRPGTANGVVFVTLEDETGNVNVVVWQKVGETFRKALLGSRLMVVYGEVQHVDGVLHVIARRLEDRSALLGNLFTRSRDFH
ncbi:error-prone DNA polymerase [Silvimonas iriomotensis]|uniref:Error-prone DNA polymerase n=1 Tax=Silvimonas iriomotensis TaxID=449662 RepID=A0ABQ2P513_9NEIS|nr:error-prone DNA polymerase [Silvimonas iriomotensis]GGP18302.1 error-prone DNA polymerase [Silvimonas iriomotensis]